MSTSTLFAFFRYFFACGALLFRAFLVFSVWFQAKINQGIGYCCVTIVHLPAYRQINFTKWLFMIYYSTPLCMVSMVYDRNLARVPDKSRISAWYSESWKQNKISQSVTSLLTKSAIPNPYKRSLFYKIILLFASKLYSNSSVAIPPATTFPITIAAG